MSTHIALLRAINVAGKNRVAMADLRALFTELGFTGAQAILQSGNVVFDGGRRQPAALEKLLERETSKQLGVSPDYLVRTAAEWQAIVAGNPFPKEAQRDPGHLVLNCLKKAPPAKNVAALQAAIRGPEIVRAVGRDLYIVYPDGIGRSKLTTALIESKLGTRGTGRNWNTVLKLAALVG
jgi:uncharacterized protein (DUF1697 family)